MRTAFKVVCVHSDGTLHSAAIQGSRSRTYKLGKYIYANPNSPGLACWESLYQAYDWIQFLDSLNMPRSFKIFEAEVVEVPLSVYSVQSCRKFSPGLRTGKLNWVWQGGHWPANTVLCTKVKLVRERK